MKPDEKIGANRLLEYSQGVMPTAFLRASRTTTDTSGNTTNQVKKMPEIPHDLASSKKLRGMTAR